MGRSDLAIVIPAFCEEATIGHVVSAACRHGVVLVVDDGSHDATADQARAAGAEVIRQQNAGYEAALSRGMAFAAERGFCWAVTMDADGEHDPETLAAFKVRLIEQDVPLVLGYRPRKQRIAEVVMGAYIRWRYGVRDILCGMKGYRLTLLEANGGFDRGGSIGTELAINSIRRGARFAQIPVDGTRRRDAPRFDRRWRANVRIFRALWRTLRQDSVIAKP